MVGEIVNKVEQAQIEQIDLSTFKSTGDLKEIDLKDQLCNELVLKEKDFRDWIRAHDWDIYSNKRVCLHCSNDAIIPAWAFMLVTAQLRPASEIIFGSPEQADEESFFDNLKNWNIDHLRDKRVMVKGCSDLPNPNKAYVILTGKLMDVVKSLMFGEPCSAVPVYKRK